MVVNKHVLKHLQHFDKCSIDFYLSLQGNEQQYQQTYIRLIEKRINSLIHHGKILQYFLSLIPVEKVTFHTFYL